MITKTYDYYDDKTQLEGYLAYHESDAKKPAVLVAHDWEDVENLRVMVLKEWPS